MLEVIVLVSSASKAKGKSTQKKAVPKKVVKRNSVKKSTVSKSKVKKTTSVHKKIESKPEVKKVKTQISLVKFNNYFLIIVALIAVSLLSVVVLRQYGVIGNKIAAKVNGDVITVKTLDSEYSLYQKVFQITDQNVFSKQIMLGLLIDEKLLLQEAGRLGIDVNDAELENYLDFIISQSSVPMTKEDFKYEFEKNNISYSHVRELYRKQMILNLLLNETILSKIEVTDDEIRAMYEMGDGNNLLNYDSVKPVIESQIYNQKKDDLYKQFVEGLRNSSVVENLIYSDLTDFARCLHNKNIVLYGSYSDVFTKRQVETFGKAFQFLNYVECKDPATGRLKAECADMSSFPYWKINDKLISGFMSIDYLSDITGCKLY